MFAIKIRLAVVLTGLLFACASAHARDSLKEQAADAATAFVYGQTSKNEALLREISDPEVYEAMAKQRTDRNDELNENVRVNNIDITEIDGDRAVAKATYSKILTKSKQQTEVHLKRVNGKWQVTTPPKSGDE